MYNNTIIMTRQSLLELNIPRTSGVYLFKKGKEVLYVGKATVLAERVRSYFDPDLAYTRSPHIARLPDEATTVEVIETDSVLEALLLEAALIKKLLPPYNTDLKDNKSFWLVAITKEDFPRITLVRTHTLVSLTPGVGEKQRDNVVKYRFLFGPFPHGKELAEALKIIRRIFPYRDKCNYDEKKKRPCFNRQIGLCPGVCSGEVTKTEYLRTIKHIELLFKGKKAPLINALTREIRVASNARRYEEASKLRDQMYALEHIRDIGLIKRGVVSNRNTADYRIEAYDVAHMGGENAYGVMTVVSGGEASPAEYRSFKLREAKGGDDVGALREILSRRLGHPEWKMPRLIVVDGGRAQLHGAESVLASLGIVIPVVAVTKNEHHRPQKLLGDDKLIRLHEREIILANSEAHRFSIKMHRKSRSKLGYE